MKVADLVTGNDDDDDEDEDDDDDNDDDVVGSVARTKPGTGRDTTSPILLNIDELLLLLDFIVINIRNFNI